jgi:hypothetical protein
MIGYDGLEVDVTTRKSLHPMLKSDIEKTAVHAVQRAREIISEASRRIAAEIKLTKHTLGQHCRHRQCITARLQ